jgi:PhzF family phenazine biosynthesis protein
MGQKLVQVDAFTDRPFAGNPAAVCVLDSPADAEWMQRVALEMNLSETAFLVRRDDGFDLRWFTPAAEVELCGHATLASAHVLWEDGHLAAGETARFFTASGTLTAEQRDDWIELDFPAEPAEPCPLPAGLEAALGAEPTWVGHNRFDYLVELATEAEVRSLAPDVAALERIDARGFVVTSPATTAPFDFVSRFFAPHVGIAEDPVTGSAHCCLGPYWADKLGKRELVGYQASKRGGVVRVRPEGERVKLLGQAVIVLRMELV